MPDIVQLALHSWTFPAPLTFVLALVACAYLRGWIYLRSTSANPIPAWRASGFLAGLFLIWVALGSPLSTLDEQFLTVHMIQHLLLMTVAPPLILIGAPVMPLLHGLPTQFVHAVLAPVFRWSPLHRAGRILSRPAFCWLAAAAALVAWHIPSAFALGLQSEPWHVVEHACFLTSGFLFWWPVVQPWPSVASWSRWSIILYLFLATLPCDILSGFLVFCDRVVYPSYLSPPANLGISALADQQCAGALMWTCVTIAYLVPAAILTTRLLATRSYREDDLAHSNLQRVAARQTETPTAKIA